MKNENPEDREANRRMLKDARGLVASLRKALIANVKRLNSGVVYDGEKPVTALADFNKAINTSIGIEADLAKRSYEQRSGGEGACALDLDSARREVFDRLAKIADARRGGDVS